MIISVWSRYKKTGKTSLIFYLANEIKNSIQGDKKLLLVDFNFKYSSLLKLFLIEPDVSFEEAMLGMQTIEQDLDSSKKDLFSLYSSKDEDAVDFTKLIKQKDEIYFLQSEISDYTQILYNSQSYIDFLKYLSNEFTLVIDLTSGINSFTQSILEISDLTLNVITQDIYELELGFNIKSNDNILYVINMYSEKIYPNKSKLCQTYDLDEKNTKTLCYSEEFKSAKNKNELFELQETKYNNEISAIAKELLFKIGYLREDMLPEKKKRLFFSNK